MECLLCHPLPGYEVWESAHWRLAVNRNQNTLGKCFLILKRHDEDICNLTPDELTDLWAAIRRVRDALRARFQPDRFNYAFLMNQDRHVHLHVIPRYDAPRAFAGMEFLDRDPIPPLPIPDPIRDQLVTTLREMLDEETENDHRGHGSSRRQKEEAKGEEHVPATGMLAGSVESSAETERASASASPPSDSASSAVNYPP